MLAVLLQLPVQRSEFDMSRLQLLNANADKSVLSTDEAKAVASHLMTNVPQVGRMQLFVRVCFASFVFVFFWVGSSAV